MTQAEINQSLSRNILNGNDYNGLIPAAESVYIKLAVGNTAIAIKEMAKWSKKYAYQVKNLANGFIDDSLEETINNIQWFLYWHIQYSIDGENQNLKSPSAAWSTRNQGSDCKSYSIFASTILLNLGIKHYLRRIKQDDFEDAFTHVYVVIPKNQSTGKLNTNAQFNKDYFIIDGTIQYNNELPFKEKDDIYMEPNLPIYGLAAGLACGCNNTQPKNIVIGGAPQPNGSIFLPGVKPQDNQKVYALSGFEEDNILQNAFDNFLAFLDILEDNGVPLEVTQKAIDKLQYYLSIGVEPTLGQLLGYEYIGGLGIVPIVAAGAASGGTGVIKGITSVLSSLIPKDFFSKTFGSIFANGFNLSCWNSTFTPAKVTAEVQKIHVPFFETALMSVRNASSTKLIEEHFNYLLKAVDISFDMYANKMWNGANWRSCSKEAIQIYVDIVTAAKTQVDILLNQFKNKYGLIIKTATVPAEFIYPQAYTGHPDFKWSEKQHGNSTYRIIKFNSNIENTLQDLLSNDNNTVDEVTGNIIDQTGGVIGNINNNQQQQASFGVGTIALLAGAAFGIWKMSK